MPLAGAVPALIDVAGASSSLQAASAILRSVPQARSYQLERVSIGESGASVYRLCARGKPTLFLKVTTVEDAPDLEIESGCLEWLAGRAAVPRLLEFVRNEEGAYLLTEALPGTNAAEAPASLRRRITEQLAIQLRQLHSLDADECPFDRGLDRVIPIAEKRVAADEVDESDFDAERIGCTAVELVDSLYRERPESEDIAVTHGDACLPNAIFNDGNFSGFVDWGRCGRADRYQDLALAHRSIEGKFGTSAAEDFLRAYGLVHVDTSKLNYYKLLDEFF